MFRWQSKLTMALVLYFAGFATAIYALAPASDINGDSDAATVSSFDITEVKSKSQQFAFAFNGTMKKCFSFAEEKGIEIKEVIDANRDSQD